MLPNYRLPHQELDSLSEIDLSKIVFPESFLPALLEDTQNKVQDRKIILPLSGGKDSVTALFLLRQLYLDQKITKIFYHSGLESEKEDFYHAQKIAGKELHLEDISEKVQQFITESQRKDSWLDSDARVIVRNQSIAALVKKQEAVVIEPFNRTELVLALYCESEQWPKELTVLELFPDIYATEVMGLGRSLKIPEDIIQRKQLTSETGTYKEEVAGSFGKLDRIIWRYVDQQQNFQQISQELGVSLEFLIKLDQVRISGQFKRTGVDFNQMRKYLLPEKILSELNQLRKRYM